jgi:hypothetical protein
VDGNAVTNNTYDYGGVDANSFNFNVSHQGELTFDLTLENITLSFSNNYNYSETLEFDHTFDQDDGLFTYITITTFNLTNVPDNFTYYYYNNKQTTDYTYNHTTDVLDCDSAIGDTYSNLDSLSLLLTYIENIETRTQITEAPTTEATYIRFRQKYLAEGIAYKFWYFETSADIYNIYKFTHNRSVTEITDFLIEDSASKYKFSLDNKTEINDIFTAEIDYKPGFDISYVILQNNGTYSRIKVTYSADLYINNVSLILDLSGDDLYMDNWSMNGTQTADTFKLTIPNIDFTPSEQSFIISGNSSVPNATFSEFVNEAYFTINLDDYKDLEEYYQGYLSYSKYSKSFLVPNISNSWTLDGVHYSEKDYTISNKYFECPGWDSSISSSYLRFRTNPVNHIDRTQKNGKVIYEINMSLPATRVHLQFLIQSENRVSVDNINLDNLKIIDLYDINGEFYYEVILTNLDQGMNKVVIKFSEHKVGDKLWLMLPVIIVLIGIVGIYFARKKGYLQKLRFWEKKR